MLPLLSPKAVSVALSSNSTYFFNICTYTNWQMYPTSYKDPATVNAHSCTAVPEPRGLSTICKTSYSQRYGFRLQNCKRATSMAYLMTAHCLILMGYINHTDCVWRVQNHRGKIYYNVFSATHWAPIAERFCSRWIIYLQVITICFCCRDIQMGHFPQYSFCTKGSLTPIFSTLLS
jgi:hypothetical protein